MENKKKVEDPVMTEGFLKPFIIVKNGLVYIFWWKSKRTSVEIIAMSQREVCCTLMIQNPAIQDLLQLGIQNIDVEFVDRSKEFKIALPVDINPNNHQVIDSQEFEGVRVELKQEKKIKIY